MLGAVTSRAGYRIVITCSTSKIMKHLRTNGQVGIIEYEQFGKDVKGNLHFSEWWDGEGLDFTFDEGKASISLSIEEIEAVVTASIATGMVDLAVCAEEAFNLKPKKDYTSATLF